MDLVPARFTGAGGLIQNFPPTFDQIRLFECDGRKIDEIRIGTAAQDIGVVIQSNGYNTARV